MVQLNTILQNIYMINPIRVPSSMSTYSPNQKSEKAPKQVTFVPTKVPTFLSYTMTMAQPPIEHAL